MMLDLLPVLVALSGMSLFLFARHICRPLLMETAEGDEDIKIAPGSFSQSRGEDGADIAAQDFMRQKNCGNIDRARNLGAQYAMALLHPEIGPLAGETEGKTPQVQHQIYLLYFYVVSHVIADHSPNSILAQTSMSIFQSEIEDNSDDMAEHVNDTAAYSFYILYERSPSRADEVGRIFAELAGDESSADLIAYGNGLYDKFYHYCVDQISAIRYTEV